MRLLVLTHTFPPSRHSNAKRPYYLVKGFLEAGWQVDVFTSPNLLHPGETELPGPPTLRVCRLEGLVLRLLRDSRRSSRLQQAVSVAAHGLLWPDPFAPWVVRTLRACSFGAGYDRVLVFVLPASLLLCGLRSGVVGANWTFDYQESVIPNYRLAGRRSPLQQLLLPGLARLERRTLHQAGRVVFTAETNRRAYCRQGLVPESITAHVPYFFDAALFAAPAPALEPRFQILYCGSFDVLGARTPATFLRSLARFLQQHPEARSHTRFLFHGYWYQKHTPVIGELGLEDVVSIQPTVGYEQYVQKLRQSAVLLLVVSSAHNLYMPSKIVDYFGAHRPILAFVPRDSEMRRVLQQADMDEFASDEFDVAGGAAALESLWARYRTGALTCPAEKTQFWSSAVQVPRYVEAVAHLPGLRPKGQL
jgi:hypothetical protein